MKLESVEILGCGFEWCILNAQKRHTTVYTNHSDSLHTSDGAFDMPALTSHRRAVCRGNRVFWGKCYKDISFFQLHLNSNLFTKTPRKKQKTNRKDDAQLAVSRSHPRVGSLGIQLFLRVFPFILGP